MDDSYLFDQLERANSEDRTIRVIFLAEELLSKGVSDSWVYEIYARSLIGIGRYEDALAALERGEALSDEKGIPWIVHRRATLEERRGNFETAIELWMEAHRLDPDEASFLIFAASKSFRLGRIAEAEALARKATDCSRGYPDEAWYNLGGYLAAQQRYDEALECYQQAIKLDPDYVEAIGRRDELLGVPSGDGK